MIGCDIASALAMAALVLALASGRLTYGQLLAIGLLQGIFAVFFRIAEVGALRHLVADEDLPTAIAQNTARDSAAWLAGPPLGGLLYAVRRSLPFVVDCFSYPRVGRDPLSIRKPFHEEREHEPWSVRPSQGYPQRRDVAVRAAVPADGDVPGQRRELRLERGVVPARHRRATAWGVPPRSG